MNNLYTHEKQDKVKWMITFISLGLLFIIMVGLIIGMYTNRKEKEETSQVVAFDENGSELNSEEVYNMPARLLLSEEALAQDKVVTLEIMAYVYPINASNQQVDYSVEWGFAPEHGNEPVSDYLTVTPDSDGSKRATICCYKPFGGDTILIKVTTRDGGFTATCSVIFVGAPTSFSISHDTLKKNSTSGRQSHYLLGTNKTYEFNLNLVNAFGTKVPTPDYEITLTANGSLYFGTQDVDPTSGICHYNDIELVELSELIPNFLKNVRVEDGVLKVTTGSKTVENYYSSEESDEFGTYMLYNDKYVTEDILDLTSGDGYAEAAAYNAENIEKCYFTIKLWDRVSNLSASFRVWLTTSVTGVSIVGSIHI